METRIVTAAQRELDNLILGLNGGFVSVGTGGEPIRNPDSYPTGKNFYGVDPEKVPKKAAWKNGSKLAQQMLEDHLIEHGRYPEKISFVIWGNETMRHEGILESQIFYLLGTQPVWDARDKVVDVEVIPSSQLRRPRVDIVIASAAEGMFGKLTQLMDTAVQRVKELDEADNYLRQHYLSTRATLIERGYSEAEASRKASVRIFDEPPGIYNLNTSNIAAASGSWETDIGMAHDYIKKMGHGFGNGYWGEPMEDVFRLTLAGTEKVVHSKSTSLYGVLDNDDSFMYIGGLATAIRSVGDTNPELMLTNTRDPSNPEMTDMAKFLGQEFRSRYVNPKWIEGMKEEGYAGAVEMRKFTEYLWGWDATVTDLVDSQMWQETYEVYVKDKHNLDIREFFDKNSPYAFQDMTARMLETIRKDYWSASPKILATLLNEYINSVNAQGIGCAERTCGNPRLLEFVVEQARLNNIPSEAIDNFVETVETAIEGDIGTLAQIAKEFAVNNEEYIRNREAPNSMEKTAKNESGSDELSGYAMEKVESGSDTSSEVDEVPSDVVWPIFLLGVFLVGGLLVWRFQHSRVENYETAL